jgi:hypothetical protein
MSRADLYGWSAITFFWGGVIGWCIHAYFH